MDEASLCDRIAFIQKGKILTIDPPEKIIADFPYKVFAVEADNNYKILKQLRQSESVRSVFSFGDSLHVVFKDVSKIEKEQINAELKEIAPTIEDCFMALANN